MANSYEILDSDFLGDDIELVDGDIVVNDHYDINELEDVDNVNAALLRRVNTPQGEVAVLIEDVEGIKIVRETLGNPAFDLMSEPLSPGTMLAMANGIGECVNQDDRFELLEVTRRVTGDFDSITPVYDVSYLIRANSTRAVTSIAQNQLSGRFELL